MIPKYTSIPAYLPMADKNHHDQTIELDANGDASGHRVTLRVINGPHAPRQWIFDRQATITLGRAAPSNLRLSKEPAMSKTHCELRIDPPRVHLVDLASTNGTLINEVPLAEAELHHGDVFGIGETRILVECEEVASPDTIVVSPKTAIVTPTSDKDVPKNVESRQAIDRTRLAKAAAKPNKKVPSPSAEKPPTKQVEKASEVPEPVAKAVVRPVVTSKLSPGSAPPTRGDEIEGTFAFSVSPMAGPVPNTLESRVIGAYDLLEQLGQGGMATVYRGKHRKSGEEVAIKVVQGAAAPSDKMLQLFVREASVLSQLRHARIVRCLEFGLHEQQPFIVMELIPTIDLISLLAKQPQAARIKTACWVASRVLQALDYAHKRGIVHRDVKPGNILAYREAHRLQVKLCDFGLAKCYEDAGFSAMTDDLSVRGTLAYMAPEQLRDARSARPPVDIFATGACLYRMLVGKHPTMTTQGAVFSQADFDAADLPKTLASVVAKAMQPDIKKRYEIAPEFEHALFPFHQRS